MSDAYEVTVVLTTYNRAAMLRDAFHSLTRLETDLRYEILIVDNNSSDDTPQVVGELLDCTPLPARCVREERPGIAAARNRAIREAAGEWIAFFDDDELADPHWLSELMAVARARQARVVGGAVQLIRATGDQEPLSEYLARLVTPGGRGRREQQFSPQDALNGGNQMVHRSVFDEVGGFDEAWTEGGSDTDWFVRLCAAGIPAWYTPRAVVQHLVPAYRLTDEYLRWTSLRRGWNTARHQIDRRGRLPVAASGLLRAVKAVCHDTPLWLLARAIDDRDQAVYRRCHIWGAEGFLRHLFHDLLPRRFPQRRFRQWLKFRGERVHFASPSTATGESTRGNSVTGSPA